MKVNDYRKMKQKRKSKYNNNRTAGSDSDREKARYGELLLLQQQGHIANLKKQVPFLLIPAQYIQVEKKLKTKTKLVDKCIERACSYIADYTYNDPKNNMELVVEDSKGFRTPDYIIKRKLMLQIYNIRIKET